LAQLAKFALELGFGSFELQIRYSDFDSRSREHARLIILPDSFYSSLLKFELAVPEQCGWRAQNALGH